MSKERRKKINIIMMCWWCPFGQTEDDTGWLESGGKRRPEIVIYC